MLELPFADGTVEIADAPLSGPSESRLQSTYRLDDRDALPSSRYLIRVRRCDDVLATCEVAAAGAATRVHSESAIIHASQVILAVGKFIVAFELPDLKLGWKLEADPATCFAIHHPEKFGCYIAHGEMSVSRISYGGKCEWSSGGRDNLTGPFYVTVDRIIAVDAGNERYAWSVEDGRRLPDSAC